MLSTLWLLCVCLVLSCACFAQQQDDVKSSIANVFANGLLGKNAALFNPVLDDDLDVAAVIERNFQPHGSLPEPPAHLKRQAPLPIDYIRVGRTYTSTFGSPQTPYAIRQEQAYRLWAAVVNNTGGIVMNGVRYYIQEFVYNDGADCGLMNLLYEKMITDHKVHALFAPVAFDCETPALIAERYGIPFINGADYTLPLLMNSSTSTTPAYTNLAYTRNILANYWTSGEACVIATQKAGARSYMGFYNVEIPDYVPLGYQAAKSLGMTMLQNITIVSLQDLANQLKADPANPCSGFNGLLDQVIAKDPDFLFGTWSVNTSDLINCMHRRQYSPRAFWSITNLQPPTAADAFHAFGSMRMSIWRSPSNGGNATDPVFGTETDFNRLFFQYWNVSGDLGYQATVASSGSILSDSIRRAGSLNPQAILAALDAFNDSLLFGPAYFLPNSRNLYHPYLCVQQLDAANFTLVYPLGFPGVAPVIYPWKFVYPQWFIDSLKTPLLSTTPIVLIVVFSVLGLALIVAAIIALVVHKRYHTVFIPKSSANAEWGSHDGKA